MFPQPVPPPAPWATICRSPPEVCGRPVAPEAGTALQHFPWIHFQHTEASPPHLTGLRGERGWRARDRPPLSSLSKELSFQVGRSCHGFTPQSHPISSPGKPAASMHPGSQDPGQTRPPGQSEEWREGLTGSHPGYFPLGRYARGCVYF